MPQIAYADTLTITQYTDRLSRARFDLMRARGSATLSTTIANVDAALRQTTAISLASGGSIAVDDSSLMRGIDATSLDAAIARIDARTDLVLRAFSPQIDAATADARLREIVRESGEAAPPTDLLDAIGRAILRFFSELRGPGVDPMVLWPAVGVLGIAVILFVVATLGRALPERVRREVFVRGAASEERADPLVHLRAADAALAAGHAREAMHAFYLYVIASLATRETIRYDPALTDRELLERAIAIPHADSLRDLVVLYERSWFGLREPSQDEARRARELALRVAP